MNFRISRHAHTEMQRRQIPHAALESVLNALEQVVQVEHGREAYQSRLDFGSGTLYLVRAIVDSRPDPPVVVTAYRTSKIGKYWEITP